MIKTKKNTELSVAWAEKGSYPVLFSENAFAEENADLADVLRDVTANERPRVMLVADANVVQRTEGLGTRIGRYVQAHGVTLVGAPVVLGGGEKIKCDGFQSVQRVMAAALDAKIGVNDVMLVLGGGSLLDVAGHAAAQVRGGVKLVRMPTTVAAMLDGAFAEDAALDSPNVKDAFRLESRPSAVVIDTTFARTILDGVWRGGLGEAIRHAAVRDGALMRWIAKQATALRERDMDVLSELVRACVESRVKKGATGFALWSAARLQSMSGYKLPHGYAVPIGVCIDCAYAVERGVLDEASQDLVCRALADCGALEGLAHSRHLLQRATDVLYGLDSWRLATGSEAIALPAGVGKSKVEEAPDRAVLEKVLRAFHTASTDA